MDGPPPPPPPPHGENPKTTAGGQGSGLPPGNYDIFIIPPHSSGSGFLYLPSLAVQRNSFLAGVGCTLLAVLVWTIIEPTIKAWFSAVTTSGGSGVLILVLGVGVAGWAMGKTQVEGAVPGSSAPGGGAGAGAGAGAGDGHFPGGGARTGPQPNGFPGGGFNQAPPPGAGAGPGSAPRGSWGGHTRNASADWEKAREETRQREEARKRAEEVRRQAAEEAKKKEEADRAARAQAEKQKWEQMRAREKEQREREARERLARERLAKEKAEREAREKETREKLEREIRENLEKEAKAKAAAAEAAAAAKAEAEAKAAKEKAAKEREERLKAARERAERERKAREAERLAKAAAEQKARTTSESGRPPSTSPKKPYERPTARTTDGDSRAYSGFRPYDAPRTPRTAASASTYSESVVSSSYAPSTSTARTSPPPSDRGPYSTSDPNKVVIKGVYLFTSLFPKPTAQLVSGAGPVSDGLVLRMTTEGLFIDDDVRDVAQREWDVKAWTMKLVETAEVKSSGVYILRASIRDPEGKRYVFVLGAQESWKVAKGLERLRKGSTVRALGVQTMTTAEANKTLGVLGMA
ncbi:hypothetical protein B0J12DRAFT_124824 [Macrophomina phaseolina]|uniref:Uncharacterized protein n=1 Tax=Macrophomina phaseolina TaxID=35725 RepID=A0ABQ8G7Y7_9PEZI|nr:hypothetical protein B0J12DRAFT_124824 [Macrophomina phaseolina]